MEDYELVIEVQKSREYLERYALPHRVSYGDLVAALIRIIDQKTYLKPKKPYQKGVDFSREVWQHLFNVTGHKELGDILEERKKNAHPTFVSSQSYQTFRELYDSIVG